MQKKYIYIYIYLRPLGPFEGRQQKLEKPVVAENRENTINKTNEETDAGTAGNRKVCTATT